MSLLMDALKKAEQEKKAAVSRLEDPAEIKPDDPGLADKTIVSNEIAAEGAAPSAVSADKPRADLTPSNDFTSTAELTLAPIERQKIEEQTHSEEISADKTADTEDVTLNVTMSDLDLDPLPDLQEGLEDQDDAALQHEATLAENLNLGSDTSFDETFHGVSLGEDDPELFQETMQGEAYVAEEGDNSYEETLPGVPAVQFAKDIGGEDLPTPVAAQTVFTATGTVAKTSSGYKWLLVSLVVIAVIAAGIWYYYTVTPMNRVLPSPQVARGIENMVPALPLEVPEEILTGSLNNTEQDEVDVAGAQEEVDVVEQTAAGSAEQVLGEQAPPVVASEQTEQQVMETEETEETEETALQEDEPLRAQAQRPGLPQTVEDLPSLFKISRSKASGEKNDVINEAYLAYQQGDFETAGAKYTEVLKTYTDNRDALLGLGAIALNSGNVSKAHMFYSQILRLNPRDDMVKAILVNLEGKDLLSSVSTMKSILSENPDQPVVYFTLGNIYAKQNRWPEAQQAFFDAYRLDSSNPDYAFNLAISLDHIGQRDAALDYYNTALKLADERSVSFDPATVMNRIQGLSAGTKQ